MRALLVRRDHGVVSFHGKVELRVQNQAYTLGRLSIRCVSGCRAAFSEEIDGMPSAIVANADSDTGDETIGVVWEGATVECVNVYHVTPTAIGSVLKDCTNGGWPSVRTDEKGRAVVVVPERIDVGAGERAPKMEEVYRWNGRTFDLSHRPLSKP